MRNNHVSCGYTISYIGGCIGIKSVGYISNTNNDIKVGEKNSVYVLTPTEDDCTDH